MVPIKILIFHGKLLVYQTFRSPCCMLKSQFYLTVESPFCKVNPPVSQKKCLLKTWFHWEMFGKIMLQCVFLQETQEDPLISSRKSHVKAQQRKNPYEIIWNIPMRSWNSTWKSVKSQVKILKTSRKWWDLRWFMKSPHRFHGVTPQRPLGAWAWLGLGGGILEDLPWKLWEKRREKWDEQDEHWDFHQVFFRFQMEIKASQSCKLGFFTSETSSNWTHRNGEFTKKWMQ